MRDQAAILRQLMQDRQRQFQSRTDIPENIISVVSGKGGVGKSIIALQLGISLANAGLRTLLVDSNFISPSLHILTNIHPAITLKELVEHPKQLGKVSFHNLFSSLDILPNEAPATLSLQHYTPSPWGFLDMMNRWASDYEFVIIDTHTGLSEWNVGIMQASKIIYIITVEEPTSIIDTYGFLKASRLFLPVEKFQLIINQVRNPNQGKEAHQKLNQALEHFQKFSIALAGVVEFDEQLREAIQQQTPLWEAGFDGIALQTVAKIVTQSLKLTVVESSD